MNKSLQSLFHELYRLFLPSGLSNSKSVVVRFRILPTLLRPGDYTCLEATIQNTTTIVMYKTGYNADGRGTQHNHATEILHAVHRDTSQIK